jgi:hypothetical protein
MYIYMFEYALKQLWLFMILQFAVTVAIVVFSAKLKKQDFFNEYSVLVMLYHMLLFTDFVYDGEAREKAGWSLACCIVVPVLV